MNKQLMKLKIDVLTNVEIDPTDTRFFYVTEELIGPGDTLTIEATDFFDDNGDSVTELPDLIVNNNFYNVFINGVLQMASISTYIAGEEGSLEIDVPEDDESILIGSPVVLEIINYDPSSTNEILT